MATHKTREEILDEIQARLQGRGAGRRLSRITNISRVAATKWLRDGIPRERVDLISVMTGIPPYIIRPDLFVPGAVERRGAEGAPRA